MNPTRRTFLKGLAAVAGLGLAGCGIRPAASPSGAPSTGSSVQPSAASGSPSAGTASAVASVAAKPAAPQPRSLVVIQLAGGNDGLATVLPYADGALKDNRSTLTFADDQLLKLDDKAALHPNLKGLKSLWDAKKLAIVQGVGYPDPIRSHFASMDIWASGTPGKPSQTGWLGRYLDAAKLPADNPFNAASVGPQLPLTLKTQNTAVASLQDTNTFQLRTDPRHPQDHQDVMAAFERIYSRGPGGQPYYDLVDKFEGITVSAASALKDVSGKYTPANPYPTSALGKALQTVAQVMSGGFGTRIYYVQTGGYDTHANEKAGHDRLMTDLGNAIAAFHQDISAHGWGQNVAIMTWSEFGRRVKENGSGGTDHGTAAPMFVAGDGVNGGLVGDQPSLTKLDQNGDLVFGIDFRSVYNTILTKWLGLDGQEVLGSKFEVLPIFK
ncbi:MAG TPA: DUF1501 domain-containing protein [Chloroflexota bacterium]|nr:DUF1501 domain-containing protein [Chloroflexota bacterium]